MAVGHEFYDDIDVGVLPPVFPSGRAEDGQVTDAIALADFG
jgi:hypothetical protein